MVQSLFAVGLSLQAAEAITDPEVLRRRMVDAVTGIDDVIADLRLYIFALRPSEVDDWELGRALEEVVERFRGPGRELSVEVDPRAASLLAGRGAEVVHAAREALSNAVRHSGGDAVWLRLALDGDRAVLEVADDGAGFDPARARGKGDGLSNLARRAEALGGKLEIRSVIGHGTALRLSLPCSPPPPAAGGRA